MRKFFKILGLLVVVLLVGAALWVRSNLKDRHPGYKADLKIVGETPGSISAGFAAVKITPEVPDRWSDANGDAKYNPKDGDTFTDGNGNGVFDPVWIAGFSNSKAANGIHDDLWARTMIVDDGKTRLAIVSLDVIGFMNNDVIDLRNLIPAEAGVTYAIIASTHTHEGPDLIGLWGETPFKSGINPTYMEYVKKQAVNSIVAAVKNLRPAKFTLAEELTEAIPLVKDTRTPIIYDSGIRMIKAIDQETGATLGSLCGWANHPETLWSKNLLITSDYPHYIREGIEKGVFKADSLVKPGIGGICVFMNGALGGLMCTHPSLAVKDPFTGQDYKEPSYEKAEALGKQFSLLALSALERATDTIHSGSISLVVKSLALPIENQLFRLATALGVMHRGTTGWMKMRSEISVVQIGPISMVTIPGEIYPELVNGGVEAPEGNDFGIQPRELPVVRDMMPGKYKFVFGLANDEIGYIIPKSQWDVDAPYTYNRKDSPYGEENSLGPETAFILHKNLQEIISELPAK